MPDHSSPNRRPTKIISASRRTELLGHYPDDLVCRLRDLGPDTIHTLVIWTKDPTNLLHHRPLREALSSVGQLFLHWTITGLGGTFLEPNVPPPDDQLSLLPDLVTYLGDPRRIHWRCDPLISARRDTQRVTNIDLDLFRQLAEPIARAGIPIVRTSFVTMYRKVTRRLTGAGIEADEYDLDSRRDFLAQMRAVSADLGLTLQTCCEPGFPIQRCIDGDLLQQLHPTRDPCRTDRARGQRDLCGCTASLDIGRYLPCPNRCLYCYAHPAP